ncbi:proline racemase family protein [Rhizobium sp. MC63]|uniref:Proline racemase family protein n=1 Tax=Rhizobium mulingense TaxID=3031128 RepID=A0ACC6N253_9HYPH|nr:MULTISPECIES: proline racemase family protein [unclassified Rhizobium]MDF0699213.1 proline racemase family protein [Rhizobium sp. MC63]MEA3519532.1 proline racemase family protein [Rhizobium sp. MJ31]
MNWDRSLDLLQVHCQGEIGKVIMAGAPEIPGATMLDKMNHINTVEDSLRRFVTFEPRASVAMSVNLLVAPTRADADAGFIVLQADRAHPMSGSNCICVVTALLESGRVPISEPETAGLIVARATCRDNRCLSVSLDNVPSFAEALDREVETPKWGRIKVDIAFGGVYYALVDVDQLGLDIAPANARLLAETGIELKALMAGQVSVAHPVLSGVNEVAYVMFRGRESDGAVRTCTTLQPGRVDRSPCGTGSSANLATLYARGEVAVGDSRTSRSIIGGEFLAEAIGETEVGGRRAVLPRITGRAYVYGREQLRLSDDDPFAAGFALSDTWGPQVGLLG